jgi:hypothetical protein
MALRTNRLNAQGYVGGLAVGGAQAWSVKRKDLLVNLYVDEQLDIDNKSGVPNGYNTGALLLPLKAGGMSSYNSSQAAISATNADAKMGKALAGTSAMSITVITADLDQIVAMIASGAATITVNAADLSAGVLMIATSSGTLSVNVAQLGGIIPVTATSSIAITPNVVMTALANMIAEAGGATPLSPEGLADAVWSALVAEYPDVGTMGKALADAGGAGNPWSADLATNNTTGTFGKKIQELLTETNFVGLK